MALRRLFVFSVQFGLLLACSTVLSAQLNRGTIEGTVTDQQGAAISGVEVTAINFATNVVTSTKTNDAGYYRAEALVPGTYRAHFAARGFTSLDMTGIEVPAAQVIRVNTKLKVGSVNEKIEVKAELPILQTDASNFSSTLQTDIIQGVPLAGRDLQQLTFLLPGVNNVGGPPGTNFGFDSDFGTFPDPTHLLGSAIAVNGGQSGTNAWYLDGNLNISSFGENIVVNPSPDSVSEFQAITTAFSAEYSHTGGGVFNVVLKSGTNNFHGDIYEYLRNSATNATNPFDIKGGFGKSLVQFNNFGGTLGGPVIIPHVYEGKNKTFFFFSLDASVLHQSGNSAYTVPTPLMRQGNFSEDPNVVSNGLWNPETTAGPNSQGIFTRQAFGTPITNFYGPGCLNTSVEAGAAVTPVPVQTCNFSSQIPAALMDPTAMFFVNSFPLPNHIDTLGGCLPASTGAYSICNNFEGRSGGSQDPINLSIKVDHQTGKGKYFFEWLFSPTQYRNYQVPWTGPTFPQELIGFGSPYNFGIRSQVIALGHTYAFTPNLVNEFRVSFSRQFLSTLSHPYPNSITSQSQVERELAPIQLPSNSYFPTPNFEIDNVPGGGNGIDFGPEPWVNIATGSEAYTIIDNVTRIIGKHTMKMGYIYRLDHASYESDDPTTLDFNASLAQDPNSFVGGNGLAQFMMGAVPADGSGFAGKLQSPYIRWRSWGLFVQDDFHVKPNLTLNLGLRYDLNGYFKARYYPMGNFCFTCLNPLTGLPGENIYEGSPGFPNGDVFPANHTDFAPRLNFAWSPSALRKTVIRGGYDIFYTDAIENFNAPGQSVVNGAGWGQGAGWYRTFSAFPDKCNAFGGPCEAFPLSDTTTNKTNLLFPSITGPFPAQTRENLLGGTYAFVKPTRDPMVQSYTFEIQQELPGKLAVTLAYVGTHGTHLSGSGPNNYLYNNVPTSEKLKQQANLLANYPISQYFSGQTATQLGLLYGNPVNGPATELSLLQLLEPYPFFPTVPTSGTFEGMTTYNGMNLKVEKRTSHGLEFIVAYTVSKQMDNWSVGGAGVEAVDPIHFTRNGIIGGRGGQLESTFGGPWTFQDPSNRNADRAIAVDDIPQQFNVAATYDLPVGSGKAFLNRKGIAGDILGGWKLSGNFNAQEGLPLPISCPASELQVLSTPGTANTVSGGRCNMIGDPHFKGHRTKAEQIADWINPAAFEPAFGNDVNYLDTDAQAWTFGNMKPRTDAIRGPGFWNLDSSLMKDFHLTEDRYVEFRWEVFNTLNHQNLGLPNTTYCLPPNPDGSTDLVHQAGCTFGRITGIQTDPRNMTFALKFFW
ncbi:MAG: TonB-dependent receptor [Candidatus Sulfotelmatobacter sp.]